MAVQVRDAVRFVDEHGEDVGYDEREHENALYVEAFSGMIIIITITQLAQRCERILFAA